MTSAAVRFDRSFFTRLLFAGSAWGLTLAAGFFALNASSCGLPCPADVAATTGVCVATGLVTIGPFAAFAGGRR
jgi:hypothetical protein